MMYSSATNFDAWGHRPSWMPIMAIPAALAARMRTLILPVASPPTSSAGLALTPTCVSRERTLAVAIERLMST
eukprot:14861534-Alexandrium_andersonii.AAC.1